MLVNDLVQVFTSPTAPRACPLCGSPKHQPILTLPATPLGDRFTETVDEARALPICPLQVVRCTDCGHCFLPELTEADDSYLHYLFGTGQSPGLAESFAEIVTDIAIRHNIGQGKVVLDIGANDGSWLACFLRHGCEVLAVEPAPHPARMASGKGIPVVQDYFSVQSVRASGLLCQAPRIVSMNYVFANIPDPLETLRGIAALSDDKTVISVLTGYHPAQLAVGMFDYVYHEHVAYFSCRDFARLADAIGFTVTNAREIPLKGGSIHIEMQRTVPGRKQSSLFSTMLKREAWLDDPHGVQWHVMAARIQSTRDEIATAIKAARQAGLPIIGYGASHSTTTLLYALGIETTIDLVVDDNPTKHGRFSPGTGVPVVSRAAIDVRAPACVVVLAWQHGSQIRDSLRQTGFKGKVITPFPVFTVEEFS
jgi:hypothetical protein